VLVERSGTVKAERSGIVKAERSGTGKAEGSGTGNAELSAAGNDNESDKAEQIVAARRSLQVLLDALDARHSLIIFPEGTRGKGGRVVPLKGGFYYLWLKRPDVQFVPFSLVNLTRVLPKGEVLPVPFTSRVPLGPPLEPAAKQSKESFLKEARD